jgi:hypothetical protein
MDMLMDMPKYFQEYYAQVIQRLELENLTIPEQQLVEQLVDSMFIDAITLACANVLEESELLEIETYIASHPHVSLHDAYFAAASHKETIDEQVQLELQKAVVDIEKMYKAL